MKRALSTWSSEIQLFVTLTEPPNSCVSELRPRKVNAGPKPDPTVSSGPRRPCAAPRCCLTATTGVRALGQGCTPRGGPAEPAPAPALPAGSPCTLGAGGTSARGWVGNGPGSPNPPWCFPGDFGQQADVSAAERSSCHLGEGEAARSECGRFPSKSDISQDRSLVPPGHSDLLRLLVSAEWTYPTRRNVRR